MYGTGTRREAQFSVTDVADDPSVALGDFPRGFPASPCDLLDTMRRQPFQPLCDKELFCSLVKLRKEAVGMTLQIYLAHTGQRLQTDPGLFTSSVPPWTSDLSAFTLTHQQAGCLQGLDSKT